MYFVISFKTGSSISASLNSFHLYGYSVRIALHASLEAERMTGVQKHIFRESDIFAVNLTFLYSLLSIKFARSLIYLFFRENPLKLALNLF